jgi:hypothetical protein
VNPWTGTTGSARESSIEPGLVRHILMFRLREGTAELFLSVVAAFREMARKVEGVIGFEYGTNNSAEGQNRGLTHVVTLTFASVEARDAYLPHPEHRKFADWVGQMNIV